MRAVQLNSCWCRLLRSFSPALYCQPPVSPGCRPSNVSWSASLLCPARIDNVSLCSEATVVRRGDSVAARTRPLVTMKLSAAQMQPLLTPQLLKLAAMFTRYGHQLRIAGGAVRDLLLGQLPHDLDLATTATPDQMKRMFDDEQVRMFNKNGERHGTISVRIDDEANFEVTTLRVDEVTDGRHALVRFTTDWQMDAGRRDLTVNALFLDLDGQVYDYVGGADDVRERRVRFVGSAADRVQEDYLRVLRYFRFYGRIAAQPDEHDASLIAAIRQNVDGLARISGERLWSELRRILTGNHHCELMLRMIGVGVAKHLALPTSPPLAHFRAICARCRVHSLTHPITLLTALLRSQDDVMRLHARLKLSAFERDLALFLVENRRDDVLDDGDERNVDDQTGDVRDLWFYQELEALCPTFRVKKPHEYVAQLMRYDKCSEDEVRQFEQWQLPRFPVGGQLLKQAGLISGKQMSVVLHALRQRWVDSRFELTQEELMSMLPDIIDQLKSVNKPA